MRVRFQEVTMSNLGDANNVFVFPGIGLGTIVAGATTITDTMISAAATSLADCLSQSDIDEQCLKPEISRLWEVCGVVARAVAHQAIDDGVSTISNRDEIDGLIESQRWRPRYPSIDSLV